MISFGPTEEQELVRDSMREFAAEAIRQAGPRAGDRIEHASVTPPELAELYRLDLWLNPPGFIKAARRPEANPVAFSRIATG